MRPFIFERATSPESAIAAFHADRATSFLAGGTTLLDLMKLDVVRPERVIDINALGANEIEISEDRLRLGASVRMADAEAQEELRRRVPMLTQSLALAASTQLRHMATLAGNVLQRTRCPYFRDVSWSACNKRLPGSGCAAMAGFNRQHAVLGASDACIATYPSDFAQALIALDATVDVVGRRGRRQLPFAKLHVPPGRTPEVETTLAPDELILGFEMPIEPWMSRSLYLKIRDRDSYEFALASAAVALEVDGGAVRQARIALGGVAAVPWRAREAEQALIGRVLDEASCQLAADIAFAKAQPREHNAYKPLLGRQTVARALLQAAAMEA
ncbi:FAD binding domain-containing protein [Dongia deserti]|uniref:FAD binding domain-containing protein n=1 Tax=Dongia deserti TaxID=2268030 RepID=UPI000E65107F|nr:xanthine dehydrogenase family protein subunit M [Dongia deserti]